MERTWLTRRALIGGAALLPLAGRDAAAEPGVIDRVGNSVSRAAHRTGAAVQRGAHRTGAALGRAAAWTDRKLRGTGRDRR